MLEELLQRDSTVRILAVVLAVVLWFQVGLNRGEVEVSRTFDNVPVLVRNERQEITVVSFEPRQVSVTVRGQRQVMNALSPEQLQAFIDLRGAEVGQFEFYVDVLVPRGVQWTEVRPETVSIRIEQRLELAFPVEIEMIGQPASGFVAGSVESDVSEVIVRGPESAVSRVDRVVGRVRIDGSDESIERGVQLLPVDANGERVRGLTVVPEVAGVQLAIEAREWQKTVAVSVPVEGQPADGFTVEETTADPSEVTVRGPEQDIETLSTIQTQPVDVEGASEPVEMERQLVLPEGFSAEPKTVQVTVQISAVEEGER